MVDLDKLFEEELGIAKSLSGAPSANQVHQNDKGKTHKGPASGQNSATPTRTNHGVAKHNTIPENYHKGGDDMSSKENVEKAGGSLTDASEHEMDQRMGETPYGKTKKGMCKGCGKDSDACKCNMEKSLPQGIYSSSAFVVYENTGLDDLIAKGFAQGKFGGPGSVVAVPLDGGKDPQR